MATPGAWEREAVRRIEADFQRSSDTHLLKLPVHGDDRVALYLKDESTHPTGSLKHRLARSLVLYGLCNGWIHEKTTLVEASSGSTAVSEAYFARLLGLPFVAVMPASTSHAKIELIRHYGGRCHLVEDPSSVYREAANVARETGGHYLDQFTFAERATDWRGNNNIAESIFEQMRLEPWPEPAWIVCGAGTGGTSATIGRYIRLRRHATRLCVVDPENSVFFDYFRERDCHRTCRGSSRIEGIGRPRVEPSFVPQVVDRMIRVPDAASFAAARVLTRHLDRPVGASTGTDLVGAAILMAAMHESGENGAVVTLICDDGARYADTFFDDRWLREQGMDVGAWESRMEAFLTRGEWDAAWASECASHA